MDAKMSVALPDFGAYQSEAYVFLVAAILLAIDGVRRIRSAVRLRRVGRTSFTVCRAQVVLGVTSIVLPVVAAFAILWVGPYALLVVGIVGLVIGTWATEESKDSCA